MGNQMKRDKREDMERDEMTVQEAGRKGGEATSEKYGPEFYEEIGHEGGETTSERHGPQFYHEIGKKGGQKVKDLVERGKQQREDELE